MLFYANMTRIANMPYRESPPHDEHGPQAMPDAILPAMGWTGPTLKGNAPVFSGLGMLTRFAVSPLPQAGHAGAGASAPQISSNTAPQAAHENS